MCGCVGRAVFVFEFLPSPGPSLKRLEQSPRGLHDPLAAPWPPSPEVTFYVFCFCFQVASCLGTGIQACQGRPLVGTALAVAASG